MNRRTFAQTLAGTVVAGSAFSHTSDLFGVESASVPNNGEASGVPFNLSIMLWTVFTNLPFEQRLEKVAEAGFRPSWVHAGSSSTIDNAVDNPVENQGAAGNLAWLRSLAGSVGARAMVRSGIALYGYCLPIESEDPDVQARVRCRIRSGLLPVMSWKTRVIGLREVQAGDTVGYNATFTATRPMRLALLPVGYADGLRRELSGSNARAGGWVMVKGQRAAIVGRVSMNLTVVDVTEIPSVAVGDEVVVLGDGVTADDHARLAHTISYEIVCGVRAESRLV